MIRNRLLALTAVPLASLLLAPLAGCVNQRAEVLTYRKVVDARLPRPKSYQPGEPLSLSRAMALANEDNEEIALQGENYLQALIAKNRAVSNFLPTVSFSPDYTIEQQPLNGTTSAGANVAPQVAAAAGGFTVQGNTWQRLEAPVVGNMNLSFVSYPNLRSAEQTIVQQRQLLIDCAGHDPP